MLGVGVVLITSAALAETVDVKYGKAVNLATFDCTDIPGKNVKRVCHDPTKNYMVIRLRDTYYHYCAIDAGTVARITSASSPDRFFSENIRSKRDGAHGPFDCRD